MDTLKVVMLLALAVSANGQAATCADKNGGGGNVVVSNTDCGEGFEATSGATNTCADAGGCVFPTDRAACCTACGDTNEWAGAGDACAAHSTAACGVGQGWSGSATTDDGACTACGAGEYSDDTDASACKACAAGNVAEVGAGTGEVSTAATTCTACAAGTFNTVSTAACGAHGTPACGVGQGWSGSTTADDGACADCGAGEYSDDTDASACKTCEGTVANAA